MIKKNRMKLILSSVVILLPILFGLAMWNELPDTIATHWGADGNANGYSSKAFAVFGLPTSLLLLHIMCLFFTTFGNMKNVQNKKVIGMIYWIAPTLSIFINWGIYMVALGRDISMALFTSVPLGIMFILIGNYLPKVKPNRTIGVRVKWTLDNEENWYKTHRLCGKVWVIGGLLMIFTALLPGNAMMVALLSLIAIITVVPIAYSYWFYRKQQAG